MRSSTLILHAGFGGIKWDEWDKWDSAGQAAVVLDNGGGDGVGGTYARRVVRAT